MAKPNRPPPISEQPRVVVKFVDPDTGKIRSITVYDLVLQAVAESALRCLLRERKRKAG